MILSLKNYCVFTLSADERIPKMTIVSLFFDELSVLRVPVRAKLLLHELTGDSGAVQVGGERYGYRDIRGR